MDRYERLSKNMKKSRVNSALSSVSKTDDRYSRLNAQMDLGGFRDAYTRGYEALQGAYGGWNSEDAMNSYRNTLDKANKAMSDYINTYSPSKEIMDAYDNFAKALGNFDNRANLYSNYINADAFNKAKRNAELTEKYKGASYDKIQKALATAKDEDEKAYLKAYTDYSSLEDFDKAMHSTRDMDFFESLEGKRSNFAMMNAFDEYKGLMKNADFKDNINKDAILGAEDEVFMQSLQGGKLSPLAKSIADRGITSDNYGTVPFNLLSPEMQDVGAYIYNKQGEEAYKNFMRKIAIQASAELNKEQTEEYRDFSTKNPLAGTVATIANAISSPASAFGAGVEQVASIAKGIDYNPFQGMSGAQRMFNESQSAISQEIEDWGGEIPKMAYDALSVGAVSRLGQRMFGPMYNVIMGTGSFAQTYGDALNSGMSPQKSAEKALVAGAVESVTEAVGMDWAFNKEGKTAIRTVLNQFLAEGSEEFVGSLANLIYDMNRNGSEAEFRQNVQKYVDAGYSQQEATRKAIIDFSKEVAEQFITAGLSAGFEGGVHEAITAQAGKTIDATAFNEAMKGFEGGDVYADYLNMLDAEGNLTNWQRGSLYNRALNEANEEYKSARKDLEKEISSGNYEVEDIVNRGKKAIDNYNNIFATQKGKLAKDIKVGEKTADSEGNDVKINDVVSEDGKTKVVTDNGTIEASAMTADEDTAYVMNKALKINDDAVRQAYIAGYQGGNSVQYDANVELIVDDATRKLGMDTMLKQIDTNVISQSKAIDLYKAVQKSNAEVVIARRAKNDALIAKWNKQYRAGNFDVSEINTEKLDSTKKRLVQFLNIFSKMGMNIKVIDDASRLSENGSTQGRNLVINLSARYGLEESTAEGGKYVIPTFAHESTHWMENILGEEFDTFKNLVRDYMGESKWNNFISLEQKNAKNKLSDADAESEVIARFCEDMLNDTSVADRLFATANESTIKKLINAIKKWFAQIRADIKDLMEGYESQSPEAQFARAMGEEFKKVQDAWVEMFERALAVNQVTEDYDAKENQKEKFSVKASVEATEHLMAIHNIQAEELLKTLKLGGFAMPSIAVVKQYFNHAEFGNCSVVFPKSFIDRGDVKKYGGDAWTPVFPAIDKKVDREKQQAIQNKVMDLVGGRDNYYILNPVLDYDNMMDKLQRNDVVDAYERDEGLQFAFLRDTGKDVSIPTVEKQYMKGDGITNHDLGALALVLGDDLVNEMHEQGYSFYRDNPDIVDRIRLALNEAYIRNNEVPFDGNDEGKPFKKKMIHDHYHMFDDADFDGKLSWRDYENAVRGMYTLRNGGAETIEDTVALSEMLKENVDKDEYKKWLVNLFDGIIEKEGIRNNVDFFAPSGNRRSWEALHDIVTLENIVKSMRREEMTGSTGFGGNNMFGVANKEYKSVAEMRKDMARLVTQNEEEREELRKQYMDEFIHICDDIKNRKIENSFIAVDNASEAITEAVRKYKTVQGIDRYLRREWSELNLKEDTAQQIYDLYEKIANMPTEYFEIKPTGAVYFPTVSYVVIPSDASTELKKALEDNGVTYYTFESGNDEDRSRVVNEHASEAEGTLFSRKVDSQGNELTEEQERFFADSKVRDAEGNLLVMYHGTDSYKDFTVFKAGQNGYLGKGMYFTEKDYIAKKYAEQNGYEGRVYKVYLNLTNPLIVTTDNPALEILGEKVAKRRAEKNSYSTRWLTPADIKKLQAKGYDGIIWKYGKSPIEASTWNANQIKLTSNTKPTLNEDIRYSKKVDSKGNSLTNAQAEFFEDSKIRDANGNLKVMYHVSPNEFTVFDKKKAKGSGSYGSGFYFSDAEMKYYGGKTYAVYLNIKNPISSVHGAKTFTDEQIKRFVQAVADNEDYGLDNYGYDATVSKVVNQMKGRSDYAIMQDINGACIGNFVEAVKLFNEVNGTNFDGIEVPSEVVAFYPEQIKNVDNKKPTENPDIRYSQKVFDDEYRKLAYNNPEEARKILEATAREHGYNSPILYHGSMDWGFTEFQPVMLDDGFSIFLTSDLDTAQTYAGSREVGTTKENLFNVYWNKDSEGKLKLTSLKDIIDFYNTKLEGNKKASIAEEKEILDDLKQEQKEAKSRANKIMSFTPETIKESFRWNRGSEVITLEQCKKLKGFADRIAKQFYKFSMVNTISEFREVDSEMQHIFKEVSDYLRKDVKADSGVDFFHDFTNVAPIGAYPNIKRNMLRWLSALDALENENVVKLSSEYVKRYLGEGEFINYVEDFRKNRGAIYPLYAKLNNTLEIDAKGSNWNEIRVPEELADVVNIEEWSFDGTYGYTNTRAFTDYAHKIGYDSVHIKNVKDDGGRSVNRSSVADIYIVFNPASVASADLLTYDEGKVIPLSERFTESDDIRYSRKVAMGDFEEITDKKLGLTDERIDKLVSGGYYGSINPDYAQAYIAYMSPDEFLKLTTMNSDSARLMSVWGNEDYGEYDFNKFADSYNRQPIQLIIGEKDKEVWGHEGRHRMSQLKEMGYTQVPVLLFDSSTKYDKKHLDSLDLRGQFNSKSVVTVKDLEPLSAGNADVVKEKFGTRADVRFSQKVDTNELELLKQNKMLEKRNEVLKADVKRLTDLLKLQSKITGGMVLDDKRLKTQAEVLLKDVRSNYSVEDTIKGLRDVYEYILSESNGGEINWDVMMGKAYDLASKMLDKQKPYKWVENSYKDIYDTMRKARIKLTDEQKQEAKNAYGKDWYKEYFGSVVIANDGRSLDSYWQEWASQYPWVFDVNTNPNDMATELLRVYDEVKDSMNVIQYFNSHEDKTALAYEIYNKFWNVPTITTLADKYQAQAKRLKFEHRQAIEELRASKKEAIEQVRASKRDVVKAVREDRDRKIADLKAHIKEKESKRKDEAVRRATLNKIYDVSSTLMDWMQKNTAKEHVPDVLKPVVSQLLNSIDYSSKQLLGLRGGENKGLPTKRDVSIRTAIEKIRNIVNKSTTEEGMEELGRYVDFPPSYAEDLDTLYATVNAIALRTGEDNAYILNEMSTEQLAELYHMVKVMKHVVQNLNAKIAGAYGYTIAYEAQRDIQANKEIGAKENNNFLKKFFEWKNTLPVYAFEHLGQGASSMFAEIQDGWDKFAFNIKQVIDFSKETFTGAQVKEWGEHVNTFKVLVEPTMEELKNGGKPHEVDVQMTDTQIMSLYCLSKREHAKTHFAGGGIRVSDIKDGKKELVQVQNVRLSEKELQRIISTLSPEQIAVADKIQDFMNTVCSDWGNEVSMKRYGIKGFTEKNYFPIKVDTNVISKETRDNEKSVYGLLNMSFTKPITPKASAQMEIKDIFDVFTIHASEMAKYNSIALPVLDMVKYYNYKEIDKDQVTTMKGSIEETFGKEAMAYINHFLVDLNGNQESGRNETVLKKLTRGYKTSAVAGNLQVMLLQPIAITRASLKIDEKYIAKGMVSFGKIKHGIEMMQKYSGIAVWKDLSLFDTNVSRGLDSHIKQDATTYDKVIEKSMKGAEWADKITWGAIWNACEFEARDRGFAGEELYKESAKKFRDIIYHTQVVDSTMTRTDMMRSPSLAVQWATSFMSEPSISMNILQDATIKYSQDARRYGKGEAFRRNGKTIAKAVEVYTINVMAESILRGLVGKWRDLDSEENILEGMWKEFLENINPLANIPLGRDIVSIFSGYSVDRMDMATVQSMYYAYKGWEKVLGGDDVSYKTIYRTMQAMSQATGIPLSSLLREATTIWNNVIAEMYPYLKIE